MLLTTGHRMSKSYIVDTESTCNLIQYMLPLLSRAYKCAIRVSIEIQYHHTSRRNENVHVQNIPTLNEHFQQSCKQISCVEWQKLVHICQQQNNVIREHSLHID